MRITDNFLKIGPLEAGAISTILPAAAGLNLPLLVWMELISIFIWICERIIKFWKSTTLVGSERVSSSFDGKEY